MKNAIVLSLLGAVLVGGAGLWWSKSRAGAPTAPVAGPSEAASNAGNKREEVPLESAPGEQRGALAATQPAKVESPAPQSAPVEAAPPQKLIELSDSSAPAPADATSGADPDNFESLWGEAKLPELKAAYKAQNELYLMNREGRVSDKSQMLTGEALERLGREVAWLKEKAFGGG